MAKRLTIDGTAFRMIDANLGAGGQGSAAKVALKDDPGVEMVVKTLPATPDRIERTKALAALALPRLSPFLAGPVLSDIDKRSIRHVAPYAAGHDLMSDRPRSFPEQVEVAHHFACQWTILEENGIAHGDHSTTNIRVSPAGAVSLYDFDNALMRQIKVPPPDMAGQHMMMAPEVRDGSSGVTIESDRFAAAVLLSMILLARHPAEEWEQPPSTFNTAMTTGDWPERHRTPKPDDIPIKALGPEIGDLFDRAFSLDPSARPAADTWRRALLKALQTCWIHRCGQAFIAEPRQSACPWCGDPVTIRDTSDTLLILVPSIQGRFRTPLKDGETITLGRANLAGLSTKISSQHLQITRYRDRLLLRHIGLNPTLIQLQNQWYRLNETWITAADIEKTPLALKLVDVDITLSAG